MKPGTHPAWQLLPGDVLDDGRVVADCGSWPGNAVLISFTNGGIQVVERDKPFNVNQR